MGPAPEPPVRSSLGLLGAPPSAHHRAGRPGIQGGGVFGAAPPPSANPLFGARPQGQLQQQGVARPGLAIMADEEFSGGENARFAGLPGFSTMPQVRGVEQLTLDGMLRVVHRSCGKTADCLAYYLWCCLHVQVNNLKELKPYGTIRKENLDRPAAWNQAALLPGSLGPVGTSSAGGGGGGGLEIFTDEEFQEEDDEPVIARPAGPSSLFGPGAGMQGPTGPSLGALLPMGGPGGLGAPGMRPGAQQQQSLLAALAPPPSLLGGLQPRPLGAGGFGSGQAAAGPGSGLNLSGQSAPGALRPAASNPLQPTCAPVAAAAGAAQTAPHVADPVTHGRQVVQGLGAGHGHASGTGASGGQKSVAGSEAAPSAASHDGQDAGKAQEQDGEEEVSFEELRAAAWFRRNPHIRPGQPAQPACTAAGGAHRPGSTQPCTATQPAQPAHAQGVSGAAAAATAGMSALRIGPEGGRSGGGGSHAAFQVLEDSDGEADAIRPQAAPRGPLAAVHDVLSGSARRAPLGTLSHPEGVAPAAIPATSSHEATSRRPLADAPAPAKRAPFAPRPMGDTESAAAAAAIPSLSILPDPEAQPASCSEPSATHPADHPSQPTITISTRGAFDLLNSMFSEDLPHQQQQRQAGQGQPQHQQQQLGVAAAAGASTHAAAPATASAAVAQPVGSSAPGAAGGGSEAANEPTITLHTRLAFDALNDMFNDTLPHEAARKVGTGLLGCTCLMPVVGLLFVRLLSYLNGMPCCISCMQLARAAGGSGSSGGAAGGGGGPKPITNSDVRRLANAGRASLAPSAAPSTAMLGPMQPSGGLCIHEDTFFLGPSVAAAAATGGGGGGGVAVGPAAAAQAPPSGPSLYEDTEFLAPPRSSSGAAPRGALLHEDTEFMTRPHGQLMAAAAAGAAVPPAAVAGMGLGGPGVFGGGLGGGRGLGGAAAVGSAMGFGGAARGSVLGGGLMGRGQAGMGGASVASAAPAAGLGARPAFRPSAAGPKPRAAPLQVLED